MSVVPQGARVAVSGTWPSIANNRGTAVRFTQYADGAGSVRCIPAGGRVATATGWLAQARTVTSLTSTSC